LNDIQANPSKKKALDIWAVKKLAITMAILSRFRLWSVDIGHKTFLL